MTAPRSVVWSRTDRRRRATAARAGAAGLLLCLGLTGCRALLTGPAEIAAPAGGIDVAASPTLGMRAPYRVRTTATVAGRGVRSLLESQKTASLAQRYVVEVTAVAGDTFDARISSDAQPEVVTARFRRDWTALAFGVEREGRYADADLATFPLLGEALALARDLSGHWRVGETRPWERTVSVPPLVSVPMRGTLTLERLVSRRGRRAAAFAYRATGEGQYGLSRVRMSLSGRCWMDLATGFMLESQTSAPGQFTQSGEPVQMEIEEERVLDLPGSRGF